MALLLRQRSYTVQADPGETISGGTIATDQGSGSSPLSTQREGLSAADVAMVNLETAVTTRGTPVPKDFTFRAPPSASLQQAGADLVVGSRALTSDRLRTRRIGDR